MKLNPYVYAGPRSAVSLRHEGVVLDVALVPGATVELPADHNYTKSLQAMGYIRPVPAKPAGATTATTTTTTKNGGK